MRAKKQNIAPRRSWGLGSLMKDRSITGTQSRRVTSTQRRRCTSTTERRCGQKPRPKARPHLPPRLLLRPKRRNSTLLDLTRQVKLRRLRQLPPRQLTGSKCRLRSKPSRRRRRSIKRRRVQNHPQRWAKPQRLRSRRRQRVCLIWVLEQTIQTLRRRRRRRKPRRPGQSQRLGVAILKLN